MEPSPSDSCNEVIRGPQATSAPLRGSPQQRRALQGVTMNIAFNKAYRRWRREAEDWQVQRILAAADMFGISPDKVTPGDILVGVIEGIIPGEATMPKIRIDRRYGPRIQPSHG
jgi:hypothetical protein